MKGRVIVKSSISHLLMKDGKPCDKYTATIVVRRFTYLAIVKYVYVVTRKTKAAVEKELEQYELGQRYDFDHTKLIRTRI